MSMRKTKGRVKPYHSTDDSYEGNGACSDFYYWYRRHFNMRTLDSRYRVE